MSEVSIERILRKAEDCLENAKAMLAESSLEASLNRSYYSIFHCVQALLLTSGVHSKTHVGSHNKFRELFIKTGIWDKYFSTILQRSFEKRQFSDYDYDEVFESEAKESVDDAVHFFTTTVLYLKENNFLQ